MRNEEIKIKIKVGSEYKEATLLKKEIDNISSSLNTAETSTETFYRRLGNTAGVVAGLVAIKETIGDAALAGFEYNKNMEQLTNSLTTLYTITSSNITTTGRLIDLEEKHNLARKEAILSVTQLQELNERTPHTLEQTVAIYNAMLPSMRKLGATNKELYEITEKLSIAAKSGNIEFQQLLAGVDGLATGTVLANSELGRFLGSLGVTNEELKKTDDVVGLITGKLRDVKAIEDFDTNISNLTNSFNRLTGSMTENAFESSKEYIKDITDLLDGLNENIEVISDVSGEITHLALAAGGVYAAYKTWNGAITIYNSLAGVSVTRTNFLGQQITTTTRRINLSTVAIKGMNAALRVTPFALATTAVYLLSDAFIDNAGKADTLEESYEDLQKRIRGLSQDQLILAEIENNNSIVKKQEEIEDLTDRYNNLKLAIELAKKRGSDYDDSAYKEAEAKLNIAKESLSDLNKAAEEIDRIQYTMTNFPSEQWSEGLKGNTEELRNNIEVLKLVGTERQKFNLQLEEQIKKAKEAGATEKEIAEFRAKETKKFNETFTKATLKRVKDETEASDKIYEYQRDIQQEIFESKLELEEAWAIEREKIEEELFDNDIDLTSDLAAAKIAISKQKFFDKYKKETKDLYTYTETTFDEMSKNMYQSMDDNLFSKWDSWMDSAFDNLGMFGDILSDTLSPIGRNLSSSIAQYFTPAMDNVTTVDTSLLNGLGFDRNDNGTYSYDTGTGVIEVNSSGLVTQGASLLNTATGSGGQSLLSLASNASTLNSIYSVLNGSTSVSTLISGGLTSVGTTIGGLAGWGGGFSSAYGAGFANPFLSGATAGGQGSAAFMAGQQAAISAMSIGGGILGGGLFGFGMDSLLGADTYAGYTGAIGGGLGGAGLLSTLGIAGGPLGAVAGALLGSVIGGVFGKKKMIDSGLQVFDTMYSDTVTNEMVKSYETWKKKSWFSSKTSYFNNDLSLSQLNQIEGLFNTINSLTSIVGGTGTLSVAAGRYSGDSLTNELLPQYLIAEAMGYDIGTLNPETFDLFETQGKNFSSEAAFAIAQGMMSGDDDTPAYSELQNITYEEYIAQNGLTDLQKIHNDMVNKISVIFEDWEGVVEDGESVIEVMGEYIGKFQTTVREFSIYNAEDDLEKLRLQREYAQQDLELLAKAAGADLAELTIENFTEKYQEAIQGNFTASTIDNWENLGDAIMSATEASKAYEDALEAQAAALEETKAAVNQNAQTLILSYTSIFDSIDNIVTPKTYTYADYDLSDLSVDNASSYISAFQTVQQNELTSLTNQYNSNRSYLVSQLEAAQAEKESRLQTLQSDYESRRQNLLDRKETIYDESEALKDTFEDIADSLDDTYASIIKQTDFGSTFVVDQYNDLYSQIKTGIEAGTDVSGLTSEFNTYANEYAEYIANTALTKTEYEEKMLTLANEVKGLAGSSRAVTLSDINDTFADELSNIDASLSSLDASFAASVEFASVRSDAKLESINSDISLLDNTFETQIQTVNDTFTNEILGLKDVLRELLANDAQSYIDDNSDYLNDDNLSGLNDAILGQTYSDYVDQAYMDVLGRTADNAGKEYWINELENGNIKLDDLYTALIYGAKDEDIQAAQNYLSLHPFADGGIVTAPVAGIIGEAGYNEAIIPLDGRDALGIQALVSKIEELTGQMDRLSLINAAQAEILESLVTKNNLNYTQFETMITELKRIS